MNLDDKDIKAVIGAKITKATGSTRVWTFNKLGFKFDKDTKPEFAEWVAIFKESAGVHGWMITRVERLTELRPGCEDIFSAYAIFGLYQHDASGTNESNSDDDWNAKLDALAIEFNQGDSNGILTVDTQTLIHNGLNMQIGIVRSGENLYHAAFALLETQYTT